MRPTRRRNRGRSNDVDADVDQGDSGQHAKDTPDEHDSVAFMFPNDAIGPRQTIGVLSVTSILMDIASIPWHRIGTNSFSFFISGR